VSLALRVVVLVRIALLIPAQFTALTPCPAIFHVLAHIGQIKRRIVIAAVVF